MGRIIDKLLGRKHEEPPKGESPVIPAHGALLEDGTHTFPNGIRMAIVDVDGVQWELINHTDEKMITFRHLDDREASKGPVFQLHEGHIADTVLEVGTLLHPKKLEQIRQGAWLDGLHPGTYFAAFDAPNQKDTLNGVKPDAYTLPYVDLIRFLLSRAAQTTTPEEFTNVSGTSAANGSGDGGGAGEQPAGGGAIATQETGQPTPKSAGSSVNQS